MIHDNTLQAWRGTEQEAWCFTVMPLGGGEKLLYASPYAYERATGQLIQDEKIVEAWHARVQGLVESHRGKWAARVPEPLHWNAPVSRDIRQQQLETDFAEATRYPHHVPNPEEEAAAP